MNKNILENLTFGFEIEGVFKAGMLDLVKTGNFVSDGSVHINVPWEAQVIPTVYSCNNCVLNEDRSVNTYCDAHRAIYHREGSVSSEFESQVYPDFNECLKDLKKFTDKNHVWNNTCGLHFHVGSKGDCRKLWGLVSNFDFLNKLVEDSKSWCACQKSRLEYSGMGNYYSSYSTKNQLILATKGRINEKYKVCRFHPEYHTLEFRFLCPCPHKVENVVKLLNVLTSYLGRSESVNRVAECDEQSEKHSLMEILKKPAKLDLGQLNIKLEPGLIRAQLRALNLGRSRNYQYALDSAGNSIQTLMSPDRVAF